MTYSIITNFGAILGTPFTQWPLAQQLYAVIGAVIGVTGLITWLARIPWQYNVRNLVIRWRTTVMTALAFTLVISLMIVMLAFVRGMNELTNSSGQPDNVIILSEGSTDESFSNLGFSDIGDIERQDGIARDGDTPLCSHETYMVINQPIDNPPQNRPRRRFLQVRGLDDPVVSARVHDLTLYEGSQWFSQAGVRSDTTHPEAAPAVEVVLGEGIARELGRDRQPEAVAQARNRDRLDVGDSFVLDQRRWLVVGIMRSAGSTFDSEVWAKRAVMGPLFGKENYTSLVLRTTDAETAERLATFFNESYTKASLKAYSEPEYFRSLGRTSQQFLVAIIIVAVIMAIGGVLGVMNTMFAAISQRIRDIGVLRLLGFARWQIIVSLVVESMLIGLLGGLLGCAIGSLADGWTATSIVSSGPGGKFVVLHLTVDATILAVGILSSLAMGYIGGLIPAVLSGYRLSPLEALR